MIAHSIFIAILDILILVVYGLVRFQTVFVEEMILNPFIVEGYVLRFFPDSDFVQEIVSDGARSLFNCFFHQFHCHRAKKLQIIHCRSEYEFLVQILFILLMYLICLPKFQNSYRNFVGCLLGIILFRNYYNYLLVVEVLKTLYYNHLN